MPAATHDQLQQLRDMLSKYNGLMKIGDTHSLAEARMIMPMLVRRCVAYGINVEDIIRSGKVYDEDEQAQRARAQQQQASGTRTDANTRWTWKSGQWWNEVDPLDHTGPKVDFDPQSTGPRFTEQERRNNAYQNDSRYTPPGTGYQGRTSTVRTYKNWFNRGYSKGYGNKPKIPPDDGTPKLTKAWLDGYDAGVRKAKERNLW